MAKEKEIGYTGLIEWPGMIQEDFLKELQVNKGYKRDAEPNERA